MMRSSNPSPELGSLRERRVDLMISVKLMEESSAPPADIESRQVALLSVNSRIAALEKLRVYGRGE